MLSLVAWTGEGSINNDKDVTVAWDGDSTTFIHSRIHNYPWISVDFGRSFRITKVYIQGALNINHHPLNNVEVRVGARRAESPYDDSRPGDELLYGNSQCNVFYGPALIANQWIEFDCGFKQGILGRLDIYLL